MLLSVIIPNFNNEKYIGKCIDSVLEQTLVPDEIIVVDDCSTDSSADIIREYEKKYNAVKPIFLDKNVGVSAARNIGLKSASSDFVTTLDADDFYYNNHKLENEMKLISEKGENTVAYSKIVYCDEQDSIIRYLNYPNKEYFQGDIYIHLLADRIKRTLMRDCVYSKKAATDAGLYNEELSLFEDYDFLIKLSQEHQFYCTFEYGTAYRQKSSGLSHRSPEELKSAKDKILNSYIPKLDGKQMKKLRQDKRLIFLDRLKYFIGKGKG